MTISINGTSGIVNDATDLNYTGTLTGGTGVVNLGSGQVYKDASGNVGIGTTSPAATLDARSTSAAVARFSRSGTSGQLTSIVFEDGSATLGSGGTTRIASSTGYLTFSTGGTSGDTAGGTERARIDSSGNLLVGDTTNTGTSKLLVVADTGSFNIFTIKDTGTTYSSGRWYQQFLNSTNGVAGSIQHSSVTGVTYATSSDIRLKENVETAPAALDKILDIPVRSFDWKIDAAHVDYGFIAQELYQVVPEAVGKGNDTEELTDPKGTWQVEYGRLTPLLVKAIQEQQTLITALTARITALETA